MVTESSHLVFESFNLFTEYILFFAENFDAHITRALNTHLLCLSGESCEIDLPVLHATLLLKLVLEPFDFLVKGLFLTVLVITILHELVLKLQELRVSHLATPSLPRQLILQQSHSLQVRLLEQC